MTGLDRFLQDVQAFAALYEDGATFSEEESEARRRALALHFTTEGRKAIAALSGVPFGALGNALDHLASAVNLGQPSDDDGGPPEVEPDADEKAAAPDPEVVRLRSRLDSVCRSRISPPPHP